MIFISLLTLLLLGACTVSPPQVEAVATGASDLAKLDTVSTAIVGKAKGVDCSIPYLVRLAADVATTESIRIATGLPVPVPTKTWVTCPAGTPGAQAGLANSGQPP